MLKSKFVTSVVPEDGLGMGLLSRRQIIKKILLVSGILFADDNCRFLV